MAVPLRVLAGRRQLAISQASFLPGSAERSDVLMVPAEAEERRQLHLDRMVLSDPNRSYGVNSFQFLCD
jgi:hypothetical protein